MSSPPKAYQRFIETFPELGAAWESIRAGEDGPLDEKTRRLIKFAVAVGQEAEGASHSAVRKAVRAGASREELLQVIALAASTIGMPASVKAHCWLTDVTDEA